MKFEFRCECGKVYVFSDRHIGRKGQCSECQHKFRVRRQAKSANEFDWNEVDDILDFESSDSTTEIQTLKCRSCGLIDEYANPELMFCSRCGSEAFEDPAKEQNAQIRTTFLNPEVPRVLVATRHERLTFPRHELESWRCVIKGYRCLYRACWAEAAFWLSVVALIFLALSNAGGRHGAALIVLFAFMAIGVFWLVASVQLLRVPWRHGLRLLVILPCCIMGCVVSYVTLGPNIVGGGLIFTSASAALSWTLFTPFFCVTCISIGKYELALRFVMVTVVGIASVALCYKALKFLTDWWPEGFGIFISLFVVAPTLVLNYRARIAALRELHDNLVCASRS